MWFKPTVHPQTSRSDPASDMLSSVHVYAEEHTSMTFTFTFTFTLPYLNLPYLTLPYLTLPYRPPGLRGVQADWARARRRRLARAAKGM